jgi:predicted nicotinamide N-methyase
VTPEQRRAFIAAHTVVEPAPFVPEIRLHLGGLAMPLWEAAALADERLPVPPPYWAWPWAGGQMLARYVLDAPDLVRGRRVADIGTGGGIVAIAAALAGAARVDAIDIEPYAIEACRLNAAVNRVGDVVLPCEADPVGTDDGWDVVLAGDVWYEADLAGTMEPWLRRLAVRGADVLTGDLGRAYLPADGLTELARATVPTLVDLEDVTHKEARVLRVTSMPLAAPRRGSP